AKCHFNLPSEARCHSLCKTVRDTGSNAVVSRDIIDGVTVELGARAKGREISGTEDYSCLREAQSAYYCNFSNTNVDHTRSMPCTPRKKEYLMRRPTTLALLLIVLSTAGCA